MLEDCQNGYRAVSQNTRCRFAQPELIATLLPSNAPSRAPTGRESFPANRCGFCLWSTRLGLSTELTSEQRLTVPIQLLSTRRSRKPIVPRDNTSFLRPTPARFRWFALEFVGPQTARNLRISKNRLATTLGSAVHAAGHRVRSVECRTNGRRQFACWSISPLVPAGDCSCRFDQATENG